MRPVLIVKTFEWNNAPKGNPRLIAWSWWNLILAAFGVSVTQLSAQPISAFVAPPTTNATLGSTVELCVQVTGTPPFTFQWRKNGVLLPAATGSCLTLANLSVADGGSYQAVIHHPERSLVSEEAQVIVELTPTAGGDAFSSSTEVFALNNGVQGNSAGASREPGEPIHAGGVSSNSVWYSWTAPISGIATFDTQGSTYDTLLAVYTGDDLTNLVEVVSDDDSGGFHTSLVRWNAQEGTTYRIAIDGLTAETGSYNCNWNLEITTNRVPIITAQPHSVTVTAGATAVFTAGVETPNPGLIYQWYRNGTPLPSANDLTLIVPYVNASHLGQYTFAVTNPTGLSATSVPAHLEIGPSPDVYSRDKVGELPLGESLASGGSAGGLRALAAVFGGTFSLAAGTIINQQYFSSGTSDRCEPAHCEVPGGASRWFQLAAESDGICSLDTRGSDADTILAVYLQNFQICTRLFDPLVGCNDDVGGTCAQILDGGAALDRSSRFTFQATAGTVYRVVVDTVNGVVGTNIHFNVAFAAADPSPASSPIVPIDETLRARLILPGESLELHVAPELVSPAHQYTWRKDDRPIAGAVASSLRLPVLNYSDAGHYSVLIEGDQEPVLLPGCLVGVVTPCAEVTEPVTLLGASPPGLALESSSTLGAAAEWQSLGDLPGSRAPLIWDVSSAGKRFYRVAPQEP